MRCADAAGLDSAAVVDADHVSLAGRQLIHEVSKHASRLAQYLRRVRCPSKALEPSQYGRLSLPGRTRSETRFVGLFTAICRKWRGNESCLYETSVSQANSSCYGPFFLQRYGSLQREKSMDSFKTSALKLQKNLLDLRVARERLRGEGKDKEADQLAGPIARLEEAIRQLPDSLKPDTLQ